MILPKPASQLFLEPTVACFSVDLLWLQLLVKRTVFHLGVIMWMKCGWFQVEAVPIVEAAAAVSD